MYSISRCKNPSYLYRPQTTLSQCSRYRPKNGSLHKLGWTYCHGTMFAPRQYLFQKDDKGMERPEMYAPSRCKNPSYLYGPQTIPSEGRRYRLEIGNVRKLGWTYRHGTIFALRQYLYQKEATGMVKPEMYSPSQCKSPSYLCLLSNYPV